MRSISHPLLMLALAAAWPTAAAADDVGRDPKEIHAEVDRNGDGQIDRDEFYVRMVEVFYHADTNKDGYLNVDELEQIDEAMVFEPADRNGDGRLTLAEYVDHRFESFDAADVNSDGLLSVQEVVDYYESR